MENKQHFSNLIYEYFLMRFRFGYYKRGDSLPLVDTLCQEFRVAENTVKSALRRLRTEGYIDMRGGHPTKVLFQQTEEEYQNFISSYYSKRRDAHSDLYASAEFIFIPLLLEGLRRMSEEDLTSITSLAKQGESNDLLHFYFLILQKFNNPLVMNLFWEALFFWGVPFSRREGRPDQYAAEAVRKRINRLIDGTKSHSWDTVRSTLTNFQKSDFSIASNYLDQSVKQISKEGQIPFVWRIYRDHPQICFKLSVQILHEIYIGEYRQKPYLPSYAAIAKQSGVSVSTVRRTINALHEIGAVKPENGKGIRICPIGKPCQPVNFSNSAIRRNLSFYVQAFDLGRYTCEVVTLDFISSLSPDVKENLIDQLETELCNGQCSISIFHFLNCIINHDRFYGISEVYRIIYSLFLWGAPLKGSSGETPELDYASERFTRLLLQYLRENDADGCAATVKELIDGQFSAAEKFLLQQGICIEELHLSPTISFRS